MSYLDHVRLMAGYNAWMNAKLFDAAARLDPEELDRDRGAFFRSVLGTLNHLMVADILWLQRMRDHPAAHPALDPVLAIPAPDGLDQRLYSDLTSMRPVRATIDAAFVAFAEALDDARLDVVLRYRRSGDEVQAKRLGPVLSHVFNHQTHHRGQITTLLSQAGIDIGVTDVNALVPNLA